MKRDLMKAKNISAYENYFTTTDKTKHQIGLTKI